MVSLSKETLFNCLESVNEYPHEWALELRALEPGKNQLLLEETIAPRLAIRMGTLSGAAIQRGEAPAGARTFCVLMNDVRGHYFRGQKINTYDLMAFGENREFDTASGSALKLLTVSVDHAYLEALRGTWGAEIDLDAAHTTSLRQRVPELLRALDALAWAENDVPGAWQPEQLEIQEELAMLLLDGCQAKPSTFEGQRNDYRIVRRALDYIEQNIKSPVRLSVMCNELGTSVRNLQLQFKKHLNITPKRAVEQSRLASLRGRLLNESAEDVTVSQLACEQGFSHHSQLARDYFRAFGELPSQTLRRSHTNGGT